jgi:hypothetical protein
MPSILGKADINLSSDAATGFSSVPAGTTQAVLTVESNAIRWASSNSSPTAALGTLQFPGDVLQFVGNDYGDFLRNFQIINDTAGANGRVQGVFMNGFDRA